MKKKLDDYLVKRYPKIFRDRYGDMRTTAMCWGFECDDGWFWLIDNLCKTIQSYIDLNSKQKRIKNKFWRKIFPIFKKLSFNSKRLRKLYFRIYDKLEKEEYESIEQIIATQVKEKYGGLRFYYTGGNEKIDGMVWLAEELSYTICENCGTTKNITQNVTGYIQTLCEDCRKLKNK